MLQLINYLITIFNSLVRQCMFIDCFKINQLSPTYQSTTLQVAMLLVDIQNFHTGSTIFHY